MNLDIRPRLIGNAYNKYIDLPFDTLETQLRLYIIFVLFYFYLFYLRNDSII